MPGILSTVLATGLLLSPAALGGVIQWNDEPDQIDGYRGPIYFGDATINAPLDENSMDTYIGYKFFPETYIPDLCGASCTSTSNYNKKHPGASGEYQECKFVVAYRYLEDGVEKGLFCTMYTREYDISYATNRGQNRGPNNI
ncbi:hypothetical protein V8F20_010979, partial [Naviculisporaceae sp. PSN 640]